MTHINRSTGNTQSLHANVWLQAPEDVLKRTSEFFFQKICLLFRTLTCAGKDVYACRVYLFVSIQVTFFANYVITEKAEYVRYLLENILLYTKSIHIDMRRKTSSFVVTVRLRLNRIKSR